MENVYQATLDQVKNVLYDIMGRKANQEEVAGVCLFAMPQVIRHIREGGGPGEIDTIIHRAFAYWLQERDRGTG